MFVVRLWLNFLLRGKSGQQNMGCPVKAGGLLYVNTVRATETIGVAPNETIKLMGI